MFAPKRAILTGSALVLAVFVAVASQHLPTRAGSASAIAQRAMSMQAEANSASDPSLPAMVASVDGIAVSALEVAEMEGSLANRSLGVVRTDTTRQAALRAIVSHIVIARAAAQDGFAASPGQAQALAAREGMPATSQIIAFYEYGQLQADLERSVIPNEGAPGAAQVWNNYVAGLIHNASIVSYVNWWPQH